MSLYLGKEKINNLSVGAFASSGIDTSDATATADDILLNKTAYINGEKITGAMSEIQQLDIGNPDINYSKNSFYFIGSSNESGHIAIGDDVVGTFTADTFGNATTADVASGKTFTSASGLKITGTATNSSQSDIISEYCIGEVLSDGYEIRWNPVFINYIASIKIFIIDTLDIAFQNNDVFQTLSSSSATNAQYCVANLELNNNNDISGIFIKSDSATEDECVALSTTTLSTGTVISVQGRMGINSITFSPTLGLMFNPNFKYGVLLLSE